LQLVIRRKQEQFRGYFADGLIAMPDGENSNPTT
jgi:hypothetical protein